MQTEVGGLAWCTLAGCNKFPTYLVIIHVVVIVVHAFLGVDDFFLEICARRTSQQGMVRQRNFRHINATAKVFLLDLTFSILFVLNCFNEVRSGRFARMKP